MTTEPITDLHDLDDQLDLADRNALRRVAGADLLSVPQQHTGVTFDNPLIRHLCKYKALDPHETSATRQRDGECFTICRREDLHSERQRNSLSYFPPHHGHGCHCLWADRALQVGTVVHVLDQEAVEAGVAVDRRLANNVRDNLIEPGPFGA